MFSSFLQCCNCREDGGGGEFQVIQLSSDVIELNGAMEIVQLVQPVHLLTSQDSFDVTVTPRTSSIKGDRPRGLPVTARQRSLKDRIQLPMMRRYPVPPCCKPEDPEEWRRQELLRIYQEFVLDLHKGIHMTQLTSNQDYSDIHCQILEDLQTLNVDQGSGCIIEFPLSAVSKVYRIVKNDDKWYSAGSLTGPTPMPPLPLSNAEHIVVVEFMRRKLAFVFNEIVAAQSFLMCMELLIRRAQECRFDVDPRRGGTTGQMSHVFAGHARHGAAGPGPGDRDRNALRRAPSKNEFASAGPRLCRPIIGVCHQSEVV